MKRRILSITLILVLLFSCFPLTVAADDDGGYGRRVLASMPHSDVLLSIYDEMEDGLKNADSTIHLEHEHYPLSFDELFFIYKMVYLDHPEYVWLNNGGYSASSDRITTDMTPSYNETANDLSATKHALDAAVSRFTEGLERKSDYEKALILHNRLITAIDYRKSDNDQNAYGALVEGIAVCAGYSRAYQLLLNEVGIDAWSVTGDSVNPVSNVVQPHEWNLVLLDGDWYYTDVTWDDQGHTENDIYYSFLNCTTEQFAASGHTPDEIFDGILPVATATENNYFVRNGTRFEEWDQDAMLALFNDNPWTARVYVTGDTAAFENAFISNVSALVSKLGVPYPCGCTYYYLDREYVFIIQSTAPHTHILTAVPATPATCLKGGNIAYYTCSCGQWFKDSTATQTVAHSAVKTSPTGHTPSEWLSDDEGHWQVCTADGCDAIIDDSKGAHTDSDTCDVCGWEQEIVGIPGDANGDGELNNRDIILLQRFINDWDVTVDLSVCDVTGDETINNRDVVLLQRFLNNWDVELK